MVQGKKPKHIPKPEPKKHPKTSQILNPISSLGFLELSWTHKESLFGLQSRPLPRLNIYRSINFLLQYSNLAWLRSCIDNGHMDTFVFLPHLSTFRTWEYSPATWQDMTHTFLLLQPYHDISRAKAFCGNLLGYFVQPMWGTYNHSVACNTVI